MSRARRPIAMPRSLFSNCSNISHFTGLLISRHALPRTTTVGEHGNHGNQYPRDQRKPTSWLTGSIVINNTWLVEKKLTKEDGKIGQKTTREEQGEAQHNYCHQLCRKPRVRFKRQIRGRYTRFLATLLMWHEKRV